MTVVKRVLRCTNEPFGGMKFENLDGEGDCVRGCLVTHPKLYEVTEVWANSTAKRHQADRWPQAFFLDRVGRVRAQVPQYLNDNPYITMGYRKLSNHWDAFKSLFYFHCHSLDTWTSVATGLQSVVLYLYSMIQRTPLWIHGPSDRVCLFLFFLMGITHAPASVAYHLFGHAGISEAAFLFYQRLDFIWIFGGMVPLSLALAWYPWHAAPAAIVAIGLVSLGVVGGVLYNIKKDITPLGRIQLITVQVLVSTSPVIYEVSRQLLAGRYSPSVGWGIGIFVSLAFGAVTYGGKIPDRWRPNPLINGHAWMHVGVNAALFCEWQFIYSSFNLHVLQAAQ